MTDWKTFLIIQKRNYHKQLLRNMPEDIFLSLPEHKQKEIIAAMNEKTDDERLQEQEEIYYRRRFWIFCTCSGYDWRKIEEVMQA